MFIIYLTQTDLGSNPKLRGDRPVINYLNHGTVRTVRCFNLENAFCAIAVCYSDKCSDIRDCLHAEGLPSWKIKVIYSSYTSVNNTRLHTMVRPKTNGINPLKAIIDVNDI